jgi:hypothetical protein
MGLKIRKHILKLVANNINFDCNIEGCLGKALVITIICVSVMHMQRSSNAWVNYAYTEILHT